jgi:hypothetical protein
MSSPAQARTSNRGRFYLDSTGDRYWSVTTILKAVPKPALVYWSAKEAAKCALEDRKRIDAIYGDGDGYDAALKWIKDACWRGSKGKMDLGTAVHEAIEAWVLDKPLPEWGDDVEPFMLQFVQFLEDFDPTFLQTELTVYSRTHKYAGTLDAIVEIDGLEGFDGKATLLLDHKTGSGIYPEVALQLAAYRHAQFMEAPDGKEHPVPEVDGGAVLHLRPDGYDLIPVVCDENVHRHFLWFREGFRWIEDVSKGVVGDAYRIPQGVE